MAATATRTQTLHLHSGAQGVRLDLFSIQWDADATVELPTTLQKVTGMFSQTIGNGGDTGDLSLDETYVAPGAVSVSNGFVTVDAAATSVAQSFVTLIGY